MSPYWVAAGGALAAAVAFSWPYLPRFASNSALSPPERAVWVNRLFVLAAAADEAGESQVAAAARSLIASLVSQQEVSKRGK